MGDWMARIADPRRIPRWLAGLAVAGLAAWLVGVYLFAQWQGADVATYQSYAREFWYGLPHPHFPREYPPLSVVPFALTLIGPSWLGPQLFVAGMLLLFAGGFLALRRWESPPAAWAYLLYALAAGPATLLFRYDLVAALVAGAAIWTIRRHRYTASYGLVAAATLVKLFPIVLLPVVVIAQWRSESAPDPSRPSAIGRVMLGAGACLAAVTAVFAAARIADPVNGLGAVGYLLARPVEVEAVPATVMWLGSLAGITVHGVYGYASYSVAGPLGGLASALATAAMVVGMLVVWWRQLSGRLEAGRAGLAAICLLLCGSRVLSAQYLLWVAPALAIVVGFQLRWFAVCLLTALIFPVLLWIGVQTTGSAVEYAPYVPAVVAARNLVLVAVTAVLVGSRDPSGAARRSAPARAPARSPA